MIPGIRRKRPTQEKRQKKTLHKRGRRRARRKRNTRSPKIKRRMQDQRNSRQRRSAKETEGNLGEYEKQARNPKSHHYRATCDGDQASISPFPSRHVEITTVTRRITALATQSVHKGWGGQLMGVKKWAHYPTRQAQRNGVPRQHPGPSIPAQSKGPAR